MFLLLFIIILSGTGIYFLGKDGISIQNTPDPKQTLFVLEKALNVTSPIAAEKKEWLDENKKFIPLKGQGFGLATKANNYVGEYGNFPPHDIDSVTENSLKPLQSPVNNFFISNGFKKDKPNTSNGFHTFFSTNYVDLTMGYTKGDLKCLITLIPHVDPFGQFFCGTVDQTQIAWRKEVGSAINTTNNPNAIVDVDELSGNYARGTVGDLVGGGGYAWRAVKKDGKWKVVFEGN